MITAALLAAGLLAGCGRGGGATHQGSALSAQQRSALAYSRCRRSHGVHDFPDPDGQGNIVIPGGPPGSDLNASSPALQTASKACGPFPSTVTPAQEKQAFQKMLKAAACMRAHGVPNYPDPKFIGGSIDHEFNPSLNINPSSPAFLQAAKKCAHGQPSLVGP
ncbi:MAG: hypothetical protein ACRDMJ_03145, partial [Solirubrobacteraceae bacterium]